MAAASQLPKSLRKLGEALILVATAAALRIHTVLHLEGQRAILAHALWVFLAEPQT